jgi:hypothetical protein
MSSMLLLVSVELVFGLEGAQLRGPNGHTKGGLSVAT